MNSKLRLIVYQKPRMIILPARALYTCVSNWHRALMKTLPSSSKVNCSRSVDSYACLKRLWYPTRSLGSRMERFSSSPCSTCSILITKRLRKYSRSLFLRWTTHPWKWPRKEHTKKQCWLASAPRKIVTRTNCNRLTWWEAGVERSQLSGNPPFQNYKQLKNHAALAWLIKNQIDRANDWS